MAKIMVVDDNPKIRKVVRVILEKKGYEVEEARNGDECLKRLEKEKPDLILLDVMMPGEDGWEICKEIKSDEKHRDIPVAMLTVRASEEDMNKSIEHGADTHINKPFGVEDLLERVESLLGKDASS